MVVEERAAERIEEAPPNNSSVPLEAMPPVVLFIHNQRSGGTSFKKLMSRNYPRGSVREWTQKSASEIPKDIVNPEVRLVAQGHSAYGAFPCVGRRFAPVTFLRKPAERVVSWYEYRRQRNQEKPDNVPFPDVQVSFEEWALGGEHTEADNGQVRRLSGFDPPFGECGPEHLELAKANLRRYFPLVGLTERYIDSLVIANVVFGWRIVNQRVRARSQRDERMPADVLERVRLLNRYDEELYNYAETRLDLDIKRFGQVFDSLAEKLTSKGRLTPGLSLLEYELERLERNQP